MKKGKIIYLSGVTSTGKTSISEQIQEIGAENFYYLSNDLFQDIVSPKFLRDNYFIALFDAIISMYHTAKLLSELGHNVIIDAMVTERPEYTRDGMSHLEIIHSIIGYENLYLIEITCPIEECRRRNIERGDREEMQSDEQLKYMSDKADYYLTIDSSKLSPAECAKAILDAVYTVN